MAYRVISDHPQFSSAILCRPDGSKNTLGNLLAQAGYDDYRLKKVTPLDAALKLSSFYGISVPRAALVVHVNDTFHSSYLVGERNDGIIDEQHAIEFVLKEPTLYLGDRAKELFDFIELLRTYDHTTLMEVATLIKRGEITRYNKYHDNLETMLESVYGEDLGRQFAEAADVILGLSISGRLLKARSIVPGGPEAKNFLLLAIIACHEIQISGKQSASSKVMDLFPKPLTRR